MRISCMLSILATCAIITQYKTSFFNLFGMDGSGSGCGDDTMHASLFSRTLLFNHPHDRHATTLCDTQTLWTIRCVLARDDELGRYAIAIHCKFIASLDTEPRLTYLFFATFSSQDLTTGRNFATRHSVLGHCGSIKRVA